MQKPGMLALDSRLIPNDTGNKRKFDSDDVLKAWEVAGMLRVHVKLVRDLAGRREIPCRKVGREYRFSRRAIFAWVTLQSALAPV